jgi:CDGSH-type Zn-finger protein
VAVPEDPPEIETEPLIRVLPNGPYRVTGVALIRTRPVIDGEGDKVDWELGPELDPGPTYDLCRCGESAAKPFCDGTEERVGFNGTETADGRAYADRAWRFGEGPVVLTDDPSICSVAAFCHAAGTDVWELAEQTSDPKAQDQLKRMVRRCPSGRLGYILPPDDDPVEETLSPEVRVIDNGPYWVVGGVAVEAADGRRYEVRNRITLCRCGRSRNKPFCDGSHIRARFKEPAL